MDPDVPPETAAIPGEGELMEGATAMADVSHVEASIATPAKFIQMPEDDCQAMMSTMKDMATENNQLASVLDAMAKEQLGEIAKLRAAIKARHRAAVDAKYAKIAKAIEDQAGVEREDLPKLAHYLADLKVASATEAAAPSGPAPMDVIPFDRNMYAPRSASAKFGVGVGAAAAAAAAAAGASGETATASARFGVPDEAPRAPVIGAGLASLMEYEKKSTFRVQVASHSETVGIHSAPADNAFLKEAVMLAALPITDLRANNSERHHDLVVPEVADLCALWGQYFAAVGNPKGTPEAVASMLVSCAQELSRGSIADLSAAAYAAETTITARH